MATNRLPTATKKRTARKTDVISGPADPTESAAAGLLPQAFLELAPDAIIVADGEGRILLVNHQTEVLFGYARSELLGVPVELLLPSQLRTVHERHRAQYLTAAHTRPMGSGLELFGQRQDGSEFPVEVSLSPLPLGTGPQVMATIRDVTERKLLEAAQRLAAERRQALLQTLLRELPGGAYLVHGRQGKLVMANRAATRVWGAIWPEGQPILSFLQSSGVRIFSETGRLLSPDELITLQIVRGGAPALQRREVIRRPDGTRVPILLSAVAIDAALLGEEWPDEPGAAAIAPNQAALVLVQDISALQEAEQLKDEFISIAAHELRTPLTTIQGFASMLEVQVGPKLADWQHEAIAEIEVASMRMNALITDLLDVTRIQADRLELHLVPLDLVATVRRCLARVQATTGRHSLALEVETIPEQEQVLLEADELRLEQVLGNLLGNAVKYSPEGGPIQVTVRADQAAAVAEVRIRDHGIGIPAQEQAQLFQRFVRASNVHEHQIAGTGLGLYVCRELVERHGGQIWFESVDGVGTTFFVTLPLYAPGVAAAPLL